MTKAVKPRKSREKPEPKNDGPGQPPKFKSAAEMQAKISEYFKTGLKKKIVLIGKPPAQQAIEFPMPTITGLCIFLGFESRQSFYDYEKNPEFSYTVKRARLFIENEYEEQLTWGNTTGAIFALKNMGWMDVQKVESTNHNLNHNAEMTPDEIKTISKELEDEF